MGGVSGAEKHNQKSFEQLHGLTPQPPPPPKSSLICSHVLGADDAGPKVFFLLFFLADAVHYDARFEKSRLEVVERAPLDRRVRLHNHNLAMNHWDLHVDIVGGRTLPAAPLQESPCGGPKEAE